MNLTQLSKNYKYEVMEKDKDLHCSCIGNRPLQQLVLLDHKEPHRLQNSSDFWPSLA
jgi:hypothetical protein